MRRRWLVVLIVFGLVSLSRHAVSEEKKPIELKSKITKVVAYQDRALVTRTGELELSPGIHEIVFRNLPFQIQDESVRAMIQDKEGIKILEVAVKTYRLARAPEEKVRELQDKLQNLKDEMRKIDDNLKILRTEHDFMMSLQKYTFTPSSKESPKEKLAIKDYSELLTFIMGKLETNAESIRSEEIKKRDLTKKISLTQENLSKLGPRTSAIPRKKQVKATLEVSKQGKYKIGIAYINFGVKWKPTYDIRFNPEKKEADIICYGAVSQSSGEDWPDIKLSLSTAQPALRGWLPELRPLYVFTREKGRRILPQNYQQRLGSYYIRLQNDGNTSDTITIKGQAAGQSDWTVQYYEGTTDIQPTGRSTVARPAEGYSSVVFEIPQRANIPGDGAPHKTTIFYEKFPVEVEHITTPNISRYAYLKLKGVNEMKTPFLRGRMNIYMGNNFVGTTRTKSVLPGEKFEFTLGVDENIRVSRELEERKETTSGFFSSRKKFTYHFKIKIENYKKEDIIITVVDQLPVSQDPKVEVEAGKFSDEPNVKEKNGLLKWRLHLKPKESKELTFSFSIYFPKDKDVTSFVGELPERLMMKMKGK